MKKHFSPPEMSCLILLMLLMQPVFSQTSVSTQTVYYKNDASMEAGVYVEVAAWVYLEGALINLTETEGYSLPMRNNLNNIKVLPGQAFVNFFGDTVYNPAGQPFSKGPWYYNGDEGDNYDSQGDPAHGTANYPPEIVDWVLVSLRIAPDEAPLCRKAALLHNDGLVEFVDGGFTCPELENYNSFYIVIEHRNHLMIMSDTAVSLKDGTITYDFRYIQSYLCNPYGIGGVGQKELLPDLPGVFAMLTGNGCQGMCVYSRTDINYDDRTYWEFHNTDVGDYCNGDFNLNGDCNFNDHILWEINNCKFTTIP